MDLEQIAGWARITLPSSSSNIHHFTESGIDSLALLRFDMAAWELDTFVRSLGFTKPLRPGFRPFPIETDVPNWWVAQDIKQASGESVLLPGLCREIYVDQSQPGVATVYLRTFEV